MAAHPAQVDMIAGLAGCDTANAQCHIGGSLTLVARSPHLGTLVTRSDPFADLALGLELWHQARPDITQLDCPSQLATRGLTSQMMYLDSL